VTAVICIFFALTTLIAKQDNINRNPYGDLLPNTKIKKIDTIRKFQEKENQPSVNLSVELKDLKICADDESIRRAISVIPNKSQFQSDREFDELKQKALSAELGENFLKDRICTINEKFSYDANLQRINVYLLSFSIISSVDTPGADYIGENAFGVKKTIHSVYSRIYRIDWLHGEFSGLNLSVQMSSKEAELVFPKLKVAVKANVAPPYASKRNYHAEPTIDFPIDREEEIMSLTMIPKIFYIFDSEHGKIYETFIVNTCDDYGISSLKIGNCSK